MRTCTKCGSTKPDEDFYKSKGNKKHGACKTCYKKNVKRRADKLGPRHYKDYNLQRNFGIGIQEFDQMLVRCDGKCEGCGKRPKKKALCVDHCHDTGAVRGLLCHCCNVALGHLNDDTSVMLNLIQYLARSRPLQ